MMSKNTLLSSSESKTLLLGAALASVCDQGCVIYLYGCIGSGKSVFCKGFLHELGHIGHIHSPTYTFIESYILSNKHVCHFDLYRIIVSEELEHMGIRDYVDSHTICLIEWPQRGTGILPKKDISVTIDYHDCQHFRKVTIESFSHLGHKILGALSVYWKSYA